ESRLMLVHGSWSTGAGVICGRYLVGREWREQSTRERCHTDARATWRVGQRGNDLHRGDEGSAAPEIGLGIKKVMASIFRAPSRLNQAQATRCCRIEVRTSRPAPIET